MQRMVDEMFNTFPQSGCHGCGGKGQVPNPSTGGMTLCIICEGTGTAKAEYRKKSELGALGRCPAAGMGPCNCRNCSLWRIQHMACSKSVEEVEGTA